MPTTRPIIISLARATAGATGPEPWAREAGWRIAASDRPQWCALWYSAVLRRAGLRTPDWVMGKSILTATLPRIPRLERAQPGDLGYVTQGGHHAMVVHDDGDTITSIDGNGPGGVVVVDRRRPRSEYSGFYSIAGLLTETADTDPSPAPSEDVDDEPTRPDGWVKGLDVSHHQDPARLDYVAAHSAGYRFLVAKLSDGKDIDSRGAEHLRNAKHAGMLPGGYHFAIPWRDPRTQLEALVRAAAAAGYGQPGHLLPWLDVESWEGATGYHQAEPSWNDVAEPLAELISAEFGGVAIYMNHSDWVALGEPPWIDRYPLVAAHYGVHAGSPLTAGGLQWAIHQWRVAPLPGIYSGPIDQNVARAPLPLIGREVPAPTRIDPAEIARLQIPLTISTEEHRAFRDQVIQRQHDEGKFE